MKIQKDAVVSLHVEVSDDTGWRAAAQDFDYLHGQTGVAQLNGVELHPIIDIKLE